MKPVMTLGISYMFSIKKCGLIHCKVCKPPHLPKEIFESIHHLPDPVRDRNVYQTLLMIMEQVLLSNYIRSL